METLETVGFMRPVRYELLKIRKSLTNALKDAIKSYQLERSAESKRYYEEYRAEFRSHLQNIGASPLEAITEFELIGQLATKDIIYVGDYHTLREAQLAYLNLLRELCRIRPKIILAVEMIHIKHQPILKKYLSGRIKEDTFLKKIRYPKTWGFDWDNYRPIFEFAKENDLRMIGINSQPIRRSQIYPLTLRDKRMAKAIAAEFLSYPEHLILVLCGDLHLARSHLPGEVDRELKRKSVGAHGRALLQAKIKVKKAIVFQNSETLYERLADEDRLEEVRIVQMNDERFALFNASPIEKFGSYYNWEVNSNILREKLNIRLRDFRGDIESDVEELTALIYQKIKEFFDLPIGDYNATAYFFQNMSFLKELRKSPHHWTTAQVKRLKEILERSQGHFIPELEVLYLADFSVGNLAEYAAHYAKYLAQGRQNSVKTQGHSPLQAVDKFYYRALEGALGFLASMIVNPNRECFCTAEEHMKWLRNYHLTQQKNQELIDQADILFFAAQHSNIVQEYQKYMATAKSDTSDSFESFFNAIQPHDLYHLPEVFGIGTARQVGYPLGLRLYQALTETRSEDGLDLQILDRIRQLFFNRYEKPQEATREFLKLYVSLSP